MLNKLSYFGNDEDEDETTRAMRALAGVDAPAQQDPIPELQFNDSPPMAATPPPRQALRAPQAEQLNAQEFSEPKPDPDSGGLGVSPWAILADIALNKGRNVGSILSMGGAAKQQAKQRALEEEYKRAQINKLNRTAEGDPEMMAYRNEQARLRALEIEQRGGNQSFRERVYEDKGSPDSEHARGALQIAEEKSAATTRGRLDTKHDYAPLDRGDAALRAFAVGDANARARQGVEFEGAPQETAIREERAGREAEARSKATLPYQQELKRTPGAPAQAMLGEDGQPMLTPQQQLAREKEDRASSDQYLKETEYERGGAIALKRAEELLKKYEGKDAPGIGMIDSRKPEWALDDDGMRLRSAQNWMNNAIQRADSGAAAPIAEALDFKIRSGAQPGATEKQVRVGLEAAREHIKGQLRSASAGKEKAARGVLKQSGLDTWALDPEQPAAAPERVSRETGMLEPGNIDLRNRPHVKNADGSTSTVLSMGVNLDGREMLIPMVSDDGRVLSEDQAVDQYRRTGKHLGAFRSVEDSNRAAQAIHEDQERNPPHDTLPTNGMNRRTAPKVNDYLNLDQDDELKSLGFRRVR